MFLYASKLSLSVGRIVMISVRELPHVQMALFGKVALTRTGPNVLPGMQRQMAAACAVRMAAMRACIT